MNMLSKFVVIISSDYTCEIIEPGEIISKKFHIQQQFNSEDEIIKFWNKRLNGPLLIKIIYYHWNERMSRYMFLCSKIVGGNNQ
jgi:hypothetical protein